MADSNNSNAGKTPSSSFLPRFYRSDANKKFLQATVDQLIQPGTVKKINGYIGRQNAKATKGSDIFIEAATLDRQNYQLEPGLVLKDDLGNTTFFKDYQDYINQINVFGGNVKNHARLNKQEMYSWDPHICWDKFVNFQNYYWLPYGPDIIRISGQAEAIASTYEVVIEPQGDNNAYIFSPKGETGLVRNPVIKLYKGQTYTFEINSPGNPFSIKTARVAGATDRYTSYGLSSQPVEVGTITFTVPHSAPDFLYYQSEYDIDLGGVFEIASIDDNTKIDVSSEILGKKEYTLADGTKLSNGMKVTFGGKVTPAEYAVGNFYVEGVGDAIELINETTLELISPYTVAESVLFDTTPFDTLPFSDATAYAKSVDYLVINRASRDHNPWSRYNRWFHRSVIEASAEYNGKVPEFDQTKRAVRPIIEFAANLKLFNFGTVAIDDVDLVDDYTLDVFSTIEGSLGYNVDGVPLAQGQRVLFTADTDRLVKNKIYRVEFIDVLHETQNGITSRQIHLVPVAEPELNQVVLVKQGNSNQGLMYWYNGTSWQKTQQKTAINQAPLFDIVDNNGISYSDTSVYDGSTFAGTKIFSYKVGAGTADSNLGFALSYKNINNIGDIVFNFNLETDSFQYKEVTDVVTQQINVGYLVKSNSITDVEYQNGWKLNTLAVTQAAVRIYKNSNKVNDFEIDVFDNVNDLADLVVRVYVNGNRLDPSLWTITSTPAYKVVVLNTDISLDDVLTIKTFAAQPINTNGYYEIPVNLQNNPLNDGIVDFTLGEVFDHVGSIVDNLPTFVGTFPGASNLRDLGNISPLGTKFVQHSGPASLSIYHITSDTNNIVRAIEKNRDDYNKFKRNFIAVAETLGVDTDVVTHVNLILQQINKDKPKTFPYYFSDMVPYGAYTKTDLTVIDYRIKTYPLTTVFSLDVLSNKAVGVYLNSVQLCHGKDYTFSDQGFVVISATIQNGDSITIYEYDNTDGCFVPETPTSLGMWPKYEPKIYLDTSLVTPRMMIQGHDGSQVLAYGDYRDDLILELEKRIYNNIKVKYDPSIFNVHDVVPSYNRTTDYSLTEFNEVLAPNFYKWTSLVDRDFTKPLSYDRENSMTFNYRGHYAPDGRETPGYWRGIYRWMLDTDRPNLCPWEMLGFSEEPSWWAGLYGPAPYTSDNLIMWQDIAAGAVKEPGKPVAIRSEYAKPFLIKHIPVDDQGNIISPLMSSLSSGIITASTEGDFVFGDVSPIESTWRRSSHYPFSVILTAMLLQPAKTFGLLLDRSRIVRNLTGQLVYKTTGLRVRPADVVLPNIESSSSRVQTAGIINYLANYIMGDNLKSFSEYRYDLANVGVRLSHRIGGFTSKEKFKLLLDSKSPTAATSVFVPQEDYDVVLNSSSPVKKITYSGVVITKLQDGFEVKGYSRTQPFFKYYPWVQSGATINVGGISESYSVWTAGQQYASGKIVEYNNRYYRSKALHTATTTFNPDYYQSLGGLPITGGRDAILRSLWDRTEPITVPYGTKFRTIQEVVDFLVGYGEWLKDEGFIFDDFNSNIEQVTNWETSAKEFLFWTTQNWSTGQDKWTDWDQHLTVEYGEIVRYNGDYYRAIRKVLPASVFDAEQFIKLDGLSTVGSSVISLSPAAAKLTFNATLSVVDDIRNPFNGYEIVGVDGTAISPNFLNSYREDNAVSYSPQSDEGIYGASFYLVQKEQVVILNNTTMFNDTIYNPASGYKQERIKASGYVSTGWYGAFDVPGFIFDQAKIQDWEGWKDYALGDIVKYKEFYYSAKAFTPGVSTFEPTSWYRLDEKPSAQLIPNWTYKATQFTDFYSLDSDNFDIGQQQMAQHLIGYQKRQYLENIIQDDVSEFKFYQGMIIEKGTQNVFNKLFDVLSADDQESLTFYEEWALRVGRYGASSAYESIEFVLDESKFKNNPQGFELVNTLDESKYDFIIRQTPNDVYLKPLGYNSNPWPQKANYKSFLRSAGYVRPAEVLFTLKSIDNITDTILNETTGEYEAVYPITSVSNGDYVWATFEGASWNVYRITDSNMSVVDITYDSQLNQLTITTTALVQVPVGSYIGLSQLNVGNGFYKVVSVSLNTLVVTGNAVEWPAEFTEQNTVVVYMLVSHRIGNIDQLDNVLVNNIIAGDRVWTDDAGNGKWASWQYSPVYTPSDMLISSPAVGLDYGRAIAVNAAGNVSAISTARGEVVIFDKAGLLVPWIQRQTIVKPFIALDDSFGNNPNSDSTIASVLSMSADGRWLVTGSPQVGTASVKQVNGLYVADATGTETVLTNHGAVSIYEKDINNIYTLVHTLLSPGNSGTGPIQGEQFGSSLSVSNDTLFVGAIGYGSGNGRVYTFKYATTVEASSPYNPNGSSGTTVVLTSTTGIVAGMGVQGVGFTSNQTVVSVDSSTAITVSHAPTETPSGVIEFTTIGWKYINNLSGSQPDSHYGESIVVSEDGSTLLIAATGGSTLDGEVEVFKRVAGSYVYSETITGTDQQFGQGLAVSKSGDYVAISSIYFDGVERNQGLVTVYRNTSSGYIVDQQISNNKPEQDQFFGSKVAFANDFATLVVYSSDSDTKVPVTFDVISGNPTTFDGNTTLFASIHVNSGRVDIYDRYATKWVLSESLFTENTSTDGYGTGFAVSNNHVFVGAPNALDQGIASGRVYEYSKPNGRFSWEATHAEIEKADLSKVKKAFLYNKESNKLVSYIDVIDPVQGKIPGLAEQEISYKTYYDPATYSVGSSEVNVNDGMAWTTAQVGSLWWDLRTAKFNNSHDNDIVYRNSSWNTLAVGASIDVYEWVETEYLPSEWDDLADTEEGIALGISGLSLYGDTSYSINRRYDNVSNTFKNTYYYWVKNKKTTPSIESRNISAQDVANLIENPRGEGYKYLALTGTNSFSLVNVKPLLEDANVVLSLEYWIVENTNQNVHSQWKLINEEPTTTIPNAIEQKWFDSLCGKDDAGRAVPDRQLPAKLRYGIENRPRQSMFVNRFEALKQFVEQVNIVLGSQQLVNQVDLSLLLQADNEPTAITGLYDAVVDIDAELQYASIGAFRRPSITPTIVDGKITGANIVTKGNGYISAPYITVVGSGQGAVMRAVLNRYGQIASVNVLAAGEGYDENTVLVVRDYSVLVHSDSGANNTWSIYSYAPDTATWSRTLSQTYNTTNYWKYVDWFATGYNQFSAADYAVNTIPELNTIEATVGDLVKVITSSSGGWLLLEKYSNVASIDWTQQYRTVGVQNGTIQLLPNLYQFDNSSVGYDGSLYDSSIFDNVASIELRNILTALRDDILIDDLRSNYLKLFFDSIRYVLSEQTYVDWVFKTSLVKATHNVGALHQGVSYRNDNLNNYEDYVNEVKPFRTKVREYVSNYTSLDTAASSVTDFDLPPVYENGKTTTIGTGIVNGQIEADNSSILSYPWKHWLDNAGFKITAITVVDAGSGYQTEPVVKIISNSGSGATARAFIANGKVTRIVVLTQGSGYLSAPTIVLDGGISTTGTVARAVATIGDGVVRSNLIKMKFDRITQTYFITRLEETETLTGTGSRKQFALTWAPDVRIGQSTVTINGVPALRSTYTLSITKSTSKGYTSYAGSITFNTAPVNGATVVVSYIKDWSLLNAADRIQYYYDPTTGELGKDLTQLMTGVDYGGVIVNGMGFDVSAGWDSLPFYSEKWDSFDATYDDYITQVSAGQQQFTLPYVPAAGTIINAYHIKKYEVPYVSNGSTLVYAYDFSVESPLVTVTRTVPTDTINNAGSFILKVADTTSINVGDVVTTDFVTVDNQGPFGYNTVVTEVINGTDIRIDQIVFVNIPVGTNITFTYKLVEPFDVNLYANGTLVLTDPVPLNSVLHVSGTLAPVKIDDNSIVMNGTSAEVDVSAFGVTINDGDTIILRKSTSDGSVKPQESDYDTALTGGNLAYSSATGIRADDIIVDGDGFVTPTSSSAPEEVVPGQVVDTVAIKVFDKPLNGSANIKVDSHIANGVDTAFKMSQQPNSSEAVIVKLTGIVGDQVVSTIQTVGDDYTVSYSTREISFFTAPTAGYTVTIFSIGFSGSNILDNDYFVGDGTTTEFVTRAPWFTPATSLVYVDGVPTVAELFETDETYDSSQRIAIRFGSAPSAGALINFIIVSGTEQTFAITKTEKILTDGSLVYDLAYVVGNSLPVESNMIVRVDQEILKAPNNIYFTVTGNKLSYTIDPTKFLPYTVASDDIVVIADGTVLTPGTDYILDLSGITVKINNVTRKKYLNKELIVSVRQELGYVYIPGTPARISFAQSYDNTRTVEVISSYKHDVLDIQRTAVSVTSSVSLTPDTVEYYNYVSLVSGKLLLDRPVIDDNYVWVIKNGFLLTPSIDFKLNVDRQSIQLASNPDINDVFSLMTYGSNVLTTGISYMQFKDMLNRVHFKRLSLNKQTRLASDLRFNDLTIEVEDASTFDLPNPSKNKPGVIEINGERIEYFTVTANVSGTYTLGQLRRGTLGTGTATVYPAQTFVQEIGPSETMPYTETSLVKQIPSDGTDIINLDFVPTLSEVVDPFDSTKKISVPCDIEVFVGGYTSVTWATGVDYSVNDIVIVGSYTYKCVTAHTSSSTFTEDEAKWIFFVGNIRLKKVPYAVYNTSIAPESPEGDVEFEADFTADGVNPQIVLANRLDYGTFVTVVKRTGTAWDSSVNIQTDDSKIAKFLKATPGIWYTPLKKTT